MASSRSAQQITRHSVRRFIAAVPATSWRIAYGSFAPDGRLTRKDGKRHESLSAEQIVDLIPYCRAKNFEEMSIFVGPMTHTALYVDDVAFDRIAAFDDFGLPVLAVVETSDASHQVWFPIPEGTSAWALSFVLRGLVKGDAGAHESGAGLQPRLGRLPGFTNSKPNRRMANGLFPFVKLVRATRRPPTPHQLSRLAKLAHGVDPECPTESVASMEIGTHAAGRAGGTARVKAALRSAKSSERVSSGRSEADWREVRRMLRAGGSFEGCLRGLRARRPDKPSDYASRTVARAATSLGLRHLVPDDVALQRFCEMYLRDRRRS